MTDDLDLVRRLEADDRLPFCPYDRRSPEYWTTEDDKPCKVCGTENDSSKPDLCNGTGSRIMREAALRITALLDEIAALKRDNEQHAANYREVVGLKCELQERFDQLATQFTTAEASRDALAGKLDTIHTAAILYIGGEADVSHDAATKLIERIATIARSTEE